MKHLPATIGFLAILTLFVFFKGDPDRAVQAAPNNTYYESMLIPAQDTMRPPSDTMRHHHKEKKEEKKKEKKEKRENRERRDTV